MRVNRLPLFNKPLMRWQVCLLLTLVIVGLSGCAMPSKRGQERLQIPASIWFEDQLDWSVKARLAISDGQEGGQLAMTWRSTNQANDIRMRGGLMGPRWRLYYESGSAQLSGPQIGQTQGVAPEPLIWEATGWPIPVETLRYWLRGLESPSDQQVRRDANGRLRSLASDGWQVELESYAPIPIGPNRSVFLPMRFELSQPPYRIRVVLEDWEWLKNDSNG